MYQNIMHRINLLRSYLLQNSKLTAGLLVLICALAGWSLIGISRAAVFSVTYEAESGGVTGNAQVASAQAASGSGNNIVHFGGSVNASTTSVFAYRLFGGSDDPNRIGTAVVKKYSVFLLSPSMTTIARTIKQQNPQAKTFMYKDPTSSRTTSACKTDALGLDWGVDYCLANANHLDWFMTKGGQKFEYSGYTGHWHMNVGAPGYKEQYVSSVLKDLRQNTVWDGAFLDNIMADIRAYVPGGGYPDQYTTQAAGQTAYAQFMDYVGAQLTAAGFGSMGNNNGARLTTGLWNKYTAGPSGGYDEFWTTFGTNNNTANNLAAYGGVGWDAQMAELDQMHAANKLGVFTAQTSGGSCSECRMYGYASYLLAADGKQAFAEGNVDGESGDWLSGSPIYGWQLGASNGARSQPQANLFEREFAKGLVVVNADATASRTVQLPKPYLDETSKQVTSITIGATRGRILRLP
jgi:hypothetical protein